ncbi:type II secretion system F family protein [Arthrobacter sp. HS15c]|uniref:type II secretion system F family protein n=1 Tax=Arthrobacter sp. HS15c TaxID=3230279 RepID=UPI0034662BB3
MTALLAGCLFLAVWLFLRPARAAAVRFRYAVGSTAGVGAESGGGLSGAFGRGRSDGGMSVGHGALAGLLRRRSGSPGNIPMTLVVQQLAALLKGGRTPARLWDELWFLYSQRPEAARNNGTPAGPTSGARLSLGSVAVLGAARAAAFRGAPVSDAIRSAAPAAFRQTGGQERRIWSQLAACFDIAEASGCPLADVLTRLAAQLEVEDDAEAARETALAGPRATVSLLTWLPLMGLGLGIALGVDPLAILVGTPLGLASLGAGAVLTVAGRIWSARLVHGAAGAGVP